LPHLCENIRER